MVAGIRTDTYQLIHPKESLTRLFADPNIADQLKFNEDLKNEEYLSEPYHGDLCREILAIENKAIIVRLWNDEFEVMFFFDRHTIFLARERNGSAQVCVWNISLVHHDLQYGFTFGTESRKQTSFGSYLWQRFKRRHLLDHHEKFKQSFYGKYCFMVK